MKKGVKRVLVFLLVCSLSLPLVSGQKKAEAAKGYFYLYEGVSVTMGSKAKSFIKKAGKALKTKRKKSCAFEGLDRIRWYDSFILYTYSNSKKGAEYVNGVTFRNSSAVTKEGIHIGSSEADMTRAYGNSPANGDGVHFYRKGKTLLQIQVKSGTVSAIRYILKK